MVAAAFSMVFRYKRRCPGKPPIIATYHIRAADFLYYIWSNLQQLPYSTVAVRAVQEASGLWGLCSMDLGRRLSRQRPYHGAVSRAFWFVTMAEKGKVPGSGSDPPTPMVMGLTLAVGLL